MPHTPHEKKRVLARVRRIQGQLTALETALESDTQCTAVLQQIAAVRGAVGGLMMEVLEAHLRETFTPGESTDSEKAVVEDVNALLRSYLK